MLPSTLFLCAFSSSALDSAYIMSSIDVLRRGLKTLDNQHKARKEKLLAELKAGRPISEGDQDWLDGAANLVDEARIIEMLESAADYESAAYALNTRDRAVFDELMKMGSGTCGEHGTKRKCEYFRQSK